MRRKRKKKKQEKPKKKIFEAYKVERKDQERTVLCILQDLSWNIREKRELIEWIKKEREAYFTYEQESQNDVTLP